MDDDVFEVDERFMPIATLESVVQYMNAEDTDGFVRELVRDKEIAGTDDEDYELTVEEVTEMLYDLSLRVISEFIGATRH
jgi:hypothetical protein|tara:strand:- start:1232 stop:1471 length:240 start_codon:yes stop_codon:yes gene_type:complete